VVEQDGHFWIYGVPLQPGTNTLTVAATDPAGNRSTQAITVLRSEVEITIDEPSDSEKEKKTPSITGTISHPGYIVLVNGVKAEMHGKKWIAHAVPLNQETGTAVVQAVAIPDSAASQHPDRPLNIPSLNDMGNPPGPMDFGNIPPPGEGTNHQ
jgi:hypothetical protein